MPSSRFLAVASVIAGALVATTAQAHPRLVAANPAPNAVVSAPQMVQLRFSERLVDHFSGADILRRSDRGQAPSKLNGTHARLERNGTTMTIQLDRPLSKGAYQLAWHVVSTDTHRMSGSYNFQVR